jgi:hypothetical protein
MNAAVLPKRLTHSEMFVLTEPDSPVVLQEFEKFSAEFGECEMKSDHASSKISEAYQQDPDHITENDNHRILMLD